MNQTLNFVGRGSYFNKEEPSNCAFIQNNDSILFIDFGFNVFKQVKKLELLNNKTNVYVALTHLHSDHVEDLPALANYCKQQKIKLHIIESVAIDRKHLINFEDELIDFEDKKKYMGCSLNLQDGIDYRLINTRDKGLNKLAKIDFFKVPHAEYLTATSLKLNINGENIFYSGDCTKIPFEIKGYDEYYIEVSPEDGYGVHISVDELNHIIKENNIDKNNLYLMHLESKQFEKELNTEGFKTPKLFEINKKLDLSL